MARMVQSTPASRTSSIPSFVSQSVISEHASSPSSILCLAEMVLTNICRQFLPWLERHRLEDTAPTEWR